MEQQSQIEKSYLMPAVVAAIMASILFSSKGIFTKNAMTYGVTAMDMLTLRMVFAAPIYAAVLIWSLRRNPVAPKALVRAMLLGLVGYFICPSFNFNGLQTVSASLERILIHSSPAFILIVAWIKGREKMQRSTVIALAICYAGVLASSLGRDNGNAYADPIGVISILMSSLLWAFFLVEAVEVQKRVGAITFTSAAMLLSAALCLGRTAITGHSEHLLNANTQVYIDGILLGVVSTVAPSYLGAYALKKLGASQVGIYSMVGPLFTPVAAALYLGEQMSALQIVGFTLVFVGGFYLQSGRKK